MKYALLLAICAMPAPAQFRSIEIAFRGTGCASCLDSLPERLRRLRGVESATVDAQKQTVSVRLANSNRIRLEQVRDFVEQDGTKALTASVEASGEVTESGGQWNLSVSGTNYRLEVSRTILMPGRLLVAGEAASLHPDSGPVVLRVTRIQKAE